MSETLGQVAAELEQLMRSRTAELGVAAEFRSVAGDPRAELTKIAEQTRADALAVGASEHSASNTNIVSSCPAVWGTPV